ncbi:MAG: 6-bladed beta-propeller [Acidobacteria bacterium]|nr:6-bladed beta-propeller [Acidobacteriota bacterium]MCL5287966.1 6-bladed beta-propeller [Acidobacteriota bacterium]
MHKIATILASLWVALFSSGGSGLPTPPPAENSKFSASAPMGAIDYLRSVDARQVDALAKPHSFFGKLMEIVAGPAERPRLVRPLGITEDSRGRLIIADPGQRVVHLLDIEKREYKFIARGKNRAFQSPVGVAVDGRDNIYVSDSARGEISVFDAKGKFLRVIGEKTGTGPLQRPTGIAVDPLGRRLFVTDTLQHQVLVYDLEGKWIRTIGRRGAEIGEFNFPTFLALSGGRLYVVDSMNFRIQMFSPDGKALGTFGHLGNRSGTLNRPKGIGVDSDGNIYVVDALFETVQVFDSEGKLLYYFGSSGSKPGQFVLPTGIYINPRNLIYVADSYNRRVQIFRYRRVTP